MNIPIKRPVSPGDFLPAVAGGEAARVDVEVEPDFATSCSRRVDLERDAGNRSRTTRAFVHVAGEV